MCRHARREDIFLAVVCADASTARKMKTRAMPDVIVSWRRTWESPSRLVLTEVRREKFNSNHKLLQSILEIATSCMKSLSQT